MYLWWEEEVEGAKLSPFREGEGVAEAGRASFPNDPVSQPNPFKLSATLPSVLVDCPAKWAATLQSWLATSCSLRWEDFQASIR